MTYSILSFCHSACHLKNNQKPDRVEVHSSTTVAKRCTGSDVMATELACTSRSDPNLLIKHAWQKWDGFCWRPSLISHEAIRIKRRRILLFINNMTLGQSFGGLTVFIWKRSFLSFLFVPFKSHLVSSVLLKSSVVSSASVVCICNPSIFTQQPISNRLSVWRVSQFLQTKYQLCGSACLIKQKKFVSAQAVPRIQDGWQQTPHNFYA